MSDTPNKFFPGEQKRIPGVAKGTSKYGSAVLPPKSSIYYWR